MRQKLCLLLAGWTFDGESGNCVNIPQVAAGNTVSGRTCATALPCAEYQGIIWVYPSPGATPSTDTIVGEVLWCLSQCWARCLWRAVRGQWSS